LDTAPAVLRPLLLDLYASTDAQKVDAIHRLAETRDLRLAPVLETLARRHKSASVRVAAIHALGFLPDPGVADLLRLLAMAQSKPGRDRRAALQALANHGNNEAADLLYDLRQELPPDLGKEAVALLVEKYPSRLAYRRALYDGRTDVVEAREQDGELAELLAALFDPALSARRTTAAMALAALGDPRAIPALEVALTDSSKVVRLTAVSALEFLPHPAASHALARGVADPRLNTSERARCARALMTHDNKLAATLAFDLAWRHRNLFQEHGLDEEVQELAARRLPDRVVARLSEDRGPGAGADLEILLDLLQEDSHLRRLEAVRRAGVQQADVLPALLPELRRRGMKSEAVAAVGEYRKPPARLALAAFALDPSNAETLRRQAVEALAKQPDQPAAEEVIRVYRGSSDEEFKRFVVLTLMHHHPAAAERAGLTDVVIDRSGLVPMMLGCGVHGAIGMVLLSDAANPSEEKITFLPAMGGAIIGAGAPLVLTLGEEVTPAQAFWVTSGGAWGLTQGALLGVALRGPADDGVEDTDRRWTEALALTGQVTGLVGTWLTRDGMGKDPLQAGFMNTSLVVGGLGGLGAAMQEENRSARATAAWMLGGTTAGLLTSGLLGPEFRYGPPDYPQVFSTTWMGGWTGYWALRSIRPGHEGADSGGILLGGTAGFALANVLAAQTEPDTGFIGFLNYSFIAGNIGGLGIAAQFEDSDGDAVAPWLVGGGATGLALSGLLGRDFKFGPADQYQTLAGVGLGAWTGGYLLDILRPDHDTAASGGMYLGSSLGFAAGSVLSAYTEPSGDEVTHDLIGFGIGTPFGAGLGLSIPDLDTAYVESLMLLGGWGGLATAIATEEYTRFSEGDRALVGLGGIWGLWQGLGFREILDGSGSRTGWGAAMLGSSTGVIVAGAAAQYLEPDMDQVGRAATGGALGAWLGRSVGMLVPELDSRGIMSLAMSGGWAGLITKGWYIPPAEFTSGDYLAIMGGAGWGLFQGQLIATAADMGDERGDGTRSLGLGLGILAGEAFARAGNLEFSSVLFTELNGYSGSGLGAGFALLNEDSSDSTVSIVTSLAGWGSKLTTAMVADELVFRPDDTWEYLIGQGFGMGQGVGYADYADASERQQGAAILIGASAGYLVPMVTNQFVDYSPKEDLLITGGVFWGLWQGGWWPYALGGDGDDSLLWALIGSDVGLLASGLALSPLFDVSAARLGWIELFGMGGLALGSSSAAIFSSNNRTIAMGMSIGSTLGLIGGIFMPVKPAADSGARSSSSLASADESSAYPRIRIGDIELPPMYPATFLAPPPTGQSDAAPVMCFGVEGIL